MGGRVVGVRLQGKLKIRYCLIGLFFFKQYDAKVVASRYVIGFYGDGLTIELLCAVKLSEILLGKALFKAGFGITGLDLKRISSAAWASAKSGFSAIACR
jgi:hypothetical protein